MPRRDPPRLTGTWYSISARWHKRPDSDRTVIAVQLQLIERTARMPVGADVPVVRYATLIRSTMLAGEAERFIDVIRRGTHGTAITLDTTGSYFTEPMPVAVPL